jgi:hypothetical protein
VAFDRGAGDTAAEEPGKELRAKIGQWIPEVEVLDRASGKPRWPGARR